MALTPKGEELMRNLRESGESLREKGQARLRARLRQAFDHAMQVFAIQNPELVEKLRRKANDG